VRIALLAPLVSPLAPPFLGGAQALLYDLAAGLASRGHDVTLYAADGSHVPGVRIVPTGIDSAHLAMGRFRPAANASLREMITDSDLANTPLARAFARAYDLIAAHAGEHDLLHAHAYDWAAFALSAELPLPVIHTLHLPNLDPAIANALAALAPAQSAISPARRPTEADSGSHRTTDGGAGLQAASVAPRSFMAGSAANQYKVHLATVSHACAATYAGTCRIEAVLYNGIALERIPFRAEPVEPPAGRYLLFAGRISPEKGAADAIAIAERAGRHLLIAGSVYDEVYYAERIAPLLDRPGGHISYVGELSRERLWELMAGAEALLCPVHWDEPFGLVACEAQATGTPVIAYARGGLREVVADGHTGWLVAPGDVAAAAEAARRVGALNRRACRAWVEERFSLAAMLDAHERFYTAVCETPAVH
jgi:UDP-glucose:tetrahydrobiopterin glucosyltransferase